MEFEKEVAQEKKKNVNIGQKQEIKGMEYDDIMKLWDDAVF